MNQELNQEKLFNQLMEITDSFKKERYLSCEEKDLTSCDWCGEDICKNCGERADWDCPVHGVN